MPLYISKFRVFRKGYARKRILYPESFVPGVITEYIIAADAQEAAELSRGPRRYPLGVELVAEL